MDLDDDAVGTRGDASQRHGRHDVSASGAVGGIDDHGEPAARLHLRDRGDVRAVRVEGSNVRLPRSHSTTRSLSRETMSSAARRTSSIVEVIPA